MDRARRAVNGKHERILLEMTKQPGNDTCADCGAKAPRWASHNLGVFLCIRCGGLHRKMGTHISKIKSISLDSWSPEQIENMRQWGNLKANAKWNPHTDYNPIPVNASDSEMEKYIRNKYEKQIYRDSNQSTPPPTPPRRATNDSIAKYSERGGYGSYDNALRHLKDMGFADNARNREVLSTTNGDLSAAIEILCRLPSGSAPPTPTPTSTPIGSSTIPNISSDEKLTRLWNMGFQNEAKNRDALRRTGGNVEVAAAILLEETRNSEKSKNNNVGTSKPNPSKPNPSISSQTEQQRMEIKPPPISQSSSKSLSDTFGSLSLETGSYKQQPQPTQQQQNGFDKNAILSLFSAPQQSSITTGSNSFNSMAGSGFGQQSQIVQTQQNLTSMGGTGSNSNQVMSNSTFGNTGTTSYGSDLFGLNFNTNNSNSFGTGGNTIPATSNIPFGTNNGLSFNNNLFNANVQQNSMSTSGMMQNSSTFGNTMQTSSFASINTVGYGQLQQQTSSPGFGSQQQFNSFSNGQSNGFLPQQQKTSFNTFTSNTSPNNNSNLFSTTNMSNTNTNHGWSNMSNH